MFHHEVTSGTRPVVLPPVASRRVVRGIAVVLGLGIIALLFSWRALGPVGDDDAIDRGTLAKRILQTPADRTLYDRSAEMALDLADERRHELWLASHAMTRRLAPDWPTAQVGFIRGSFLHWPELTEADRALVENEAAVLLSTPELFSRYWQIIWVATGDLDLFLRSAPRDASTGVVLATLATNAGRFGDYRAIRDGLGKRRSADLEETRPGASDAVLQHLVSIDRRPAMRGLMQADLRYIANNRPDGKSINENAIRGFVDYAIRNRLEPLAGLFEVGFSPTILPPVLRARLAIAMNNVDLADRVDRATIAEGNAAMLTPYRVDRVLYEVSLGHKLEAQSQLSRIPDTDANRDDVLAARAEVARISGRPDEEARAEKDLLDRLGPETLDSRWNGLCSRVICRGVVSATLYVAEPTTIRVPVHAIATDEIGSYLEASLDGSITDEGVVRGDRTFVIHIATRGIHEIEIRMTNPIRRRWGPQRTVEVLAPEISSPPQETSGSARDSGEPGDEQPTGR